MMKGLRAPASDRTVLAVPEMAPILPLLESNLRLFHSTEAHPFHQGMTFGALRQLCRTECLSLLSEQSSPHTPSSPWIITGHQPELCHPGVWAKYFFTGGLARKTGAIALNLVADTDACHQLAVGFPSLSPVDKRWRRDWISLGKIPKGGPWQLAKGPDGNQKSNFWEKVQRLSPVLGWQPLIAESRFQVPSNGEQTTLGDWFSGLRNEAQESLGLTLPDVRQSDLCQGEAFGWFAGEMILRARLFREIHNRALAQFRQENGIRNPGQPVPALEAKDGWTEVPFWVWKDPGFSGRQRLWVRDSDPENLSIGDPQREQWIRMEKGSLGGLSKQLQTQGFSLRPRALTNTLFFRWFCADWFVHGLGGAIYDQITDKIGHEYYGHPAPHYGMVTATLRLPFSVDDWIDEGAIRREIRRLWWNPDQFSQLKEDEIELAGSYTQARLHSPKTIARKVLWDLHTRLAGRYAALDESMWQAKKKNQSRTLALSREWPWIFHPRNRLEELFLPLLQ